MARPRPTATARGQPAPGRVNRRGRLARPRRAPAERDRLGAAGEAAARVALTGARASTTSRAAATTTRRRRRRRRREASPPTSSPIGVAPRLLAARDVARDAADTRERRAAASRSAGRSRRALRAYREPDVALTRPPEPRAGGKVGRRGRLRAAAERRPVRVPVRDGRGGPRSRVRRGDRAGRGAVQHERERRAGSGSATGARRGRRLLPRCDAAGVVRGLFTRQRAVRVPRARGRLGRRRPVRAARRRRRRSARALPAARVARLVLVARRSAGTA